MLSEDIRNAQASLGELGGRVTGEDWDFVRMTRLNLISMAEQAASMEELLFVCYAHAGDTKELPA